MKLSASNRMTSQRRSKCSRNTRHMQSGGGAGGSVTFAPAMGGVISNPLAYASASNCQAAVRPGFLESGYRGFHGLPGMTAPMLGGRRKGKGTRKGKKSRKGKGKKTQRGGSYSIAPYDGTVAGFPGSAGIAGVVSTGCSAPSQTAIPPSGAADNLNSRSSYLWSGPMKGGAIITGSDLAAAAAPLAGVAMQPPSITVPTAGLTHLTGADSVGTTSAGTKFMINVPGDGRVGACMKGGSRKSKKGKKSRKSKKSKKSRKSKKSKRN
jgi:hypothetical protein